MLEQVCHAVSMLGHVLVDWNKFMRVGGWKSYNKQALNSLEVEFEKLLVHTTTATMNYMNFHISYAEGWFCNFSWLLLEHKLYFYFEMENIIYLLIMSNRLDT